MPSPAYPVETRNAAVLRGGPLDGKIVLGPQGDPIQLRSADGRSFTFTWGLPGQRRFAVLLSTGTVVRDYFLVRR